MSSVLAIVDARGAAGRVDLARRRDVARREGDLAADPAAVLVAIDARDVGVVAAANRCRRPACLSRPTEAARRSACGKTELSSSKFVNGNAVTLPFRTSTFDAVTRSLFVGHIPEKQWPDLFASIERVPKPEGVFHTRDQPERATPGHRLPQHGVQGL
ncbi:methyltransferase domain-containing protein, partial [Nocardia neocaledoniensis]